MISKELLEEVLGCKIDNILSENTSLNPNGDNIVFRLGGRFKVIGIYELAFKCKDWAYDKKGLYISSCKVKSMYKSTLLNGDNTIELGYYKTEPEAIFVACEWLLKGI